MLEIKTETDLFHYLRSRTAPFSAGFRDALAGKDSIYDQAKKYDCLKNHYVHGYAAGVGHASRNS